MGLYRGPFVSATLKNAVSFRLAGWVNVSTVHKYRVFLNHASFCWKILATCADACIHGIQQIENSSRSRNNTRDLVTKTSWKPSIDSWKRNFSLEN